MSSKTTTRPTPSMNGKPTANAWARPLQPKKVAGPPPGMGAAPVLRERFLHLSLSMVGQRVVVTKTDGTVFEGVLHTFTPFPGPLKNKYAFKACKAVEGGDFDPGATLVLDAVEVANVFVKSLRLDTKNGSNRDDGFRTDVEISGGKDGKGRDLVAAGSAWTSGARTEGLAPDPRAKAGLRGNIGEWDQFKANEELFNVTANFDENLYTTELDHSQIDERKKLEAARLAKEIEGSVSSNIHVAEERGHVVQGDYDEEDRYSGVLKSSLQPRNGEPKEIAKRAASKVSAPPDEKPTNKADETKVAPQKMNYAAAAAKADAKVAAAPAGATKPAIPAITSPTKNEPEGTSVKTDEQKEEDATPEEARASITPTPVEEAQTDEDARETEKQPLAEDAGKPKSEGEKDEIEEKKDAEQKEKKPLTKLNANAKSFTFNPGAKSFTPSFGQPVGPPSSGPAESFTIDPNTGMPFGGPGVPQMQVQPQYMPPYPGMGQPGIVPMMNPAHFAAIRYQSGPYPGMEHQMPMQPVQQPQHMQPQGPGSQGPGSHDGTSPVPPTSPSHPTSGDESELPPQQQPPPLPLQQQQMNQPVHMAYGGGPPGSFYPGMMPRGPGFHPQPPLQMGPPVAANPYHPMYGGPMTMPNMGQMRGPGGAQYYPPMGGMPYQPGGYGMDDDQGYRGDRGGRGGRGQNRRTSRKGGRGSGRGFHYYGGGGGGGGSGRQTPQSNSGTEGDAGESKTSTSPADEASKPPGEE